MERISKKNGKFIAKLQKTDPAMAFENKFLEFLQQV
jgi:hypothetical protein